MKIDFFTLCDGAFNYNGKLTIVGTLDGFKVHRLPSRVNLNIAMKLAVQANESVDDNLNIQIYDPEGNRVPVVMECRVKLDPMEEESHTSIAAAVQGFPLKFSGNYKVVVLIGKKQLNEYVFFVKQGKD